MEPLPQTPGIVTPIEQPVASNEPHFIVEKPKPPYFTRLFRGRLNRQNYSVGSLLLIVIPVVVYLIFVWQLLSSPAAQSLLANNPYDPTVLQSAGFSGAGEEAAFFQLLQSPINVALTIFTSIYTLVTLPIFLSLQVRRLHDLNKSGWLLIVGLIPLINYVFPLYLTFFKGTNGENNFGPVPTKRTHIKEDILMM